MCLGIYKVEANARSGYEIYRRSRRRSESGKRARPSAAPRPFILDTKAEDETGSHGHNRRQFRRQWYADRQISQRSSGEFVNFFLTENSVRGSLLRGHAVTSFLRLNREIFVNFYSSVPIFPFQVILFFVFSHINTA